MSDLPFDLSGLARGLEPIYSALTAHALSIVAALLLGAAFYVVMRWHEPIAHWLGLWQLGRSSKRLTLPSHLAPDSNGWFAVELLVCALYYRRYVLSRCDLNLYDKAQSYLRKVQELGRSPAPLWALLVVAGLTLSESVVFGMVIGALALDSITPAQQPFFAGLIGVVLASVLMLANHFAGQEWHRNELIAKVGDMAREGVRQGSVPSASAFAVNTKVSLARDESDNDAPAFQQLLHRLQTNYNLTPDWRWTKGTAIGIAALLVLTFLARLGMSDLTTTAYAAEPLMTGDLAGLDFGDGGAGDGGGGWLAAGKLSALLILSLLFTGIQAVSIYIGKAYGFCGLESRKAYDLIRAYGSREEYLNHQQARQVEIMNAAQSSLHDLQHRIIAHLEAQGVDADAFTAAKRSSERTFLAYLKMKEHEEKQREYEDLY